MTKRKTNVQIVRQMMEHSRYGILSQIFIMEAITRYARECDQAEAETLDSPLINGEAWKGTATEILASLEEHWRG